MPTNSVDPMLTGDRDALLAIRDRLAQTGVFARVSLDTPRDERTASGGALPLARLTPQDWVDTVDPISGDLIHVATYRLSLVVRHLEAVERLDQLNALSGHARLTLVGADLGGLCLPALSRIEQGIFDVRSIPPEACLVLRGQYGFLINRPF